MAPDFTKLPAWERLLAAERHLQALVPGAVLVGGTAAALHAHHRVSMDGDHVLTDLRDRFDGVLADLESAAGWHTGRVRRPVLVLGSLDGVLTGIRQLRRTAPLETEQLDGLRVPTLAEMARIKAWLLATRHTTRDYLDTVVLLERLGELGVRNAFQSLDALYRQLSGASVSAEVVERLAAAKLIDSRSVDLGTDATWTLTATKSRRKSWIGAVFTIGGSCTGWRAGQAMPPTACATGSSRSARLYPSPFPTCSSQQWRISASPPIPGPSCRIRTKLSCEAQTPVVSEWMARHLR